MRVKLLYIFNVVKRSANISVKGYTETEIRRTLKGLTPAEHINSGLQNWSPFHNGKAEIKWFVQCYIFRVEGSK